MVKEEEIRKYLRILNNDDYSVIDRLYQSRISTRRNGFLSIDMVNKLTRKKRWENEINSDDLSKYFSEIREKTYSAFLDFHILCRCLNEEQLEKIFTKTDNNKNPFTNLMISLLPSNNSREELKNSIFKLSESVKYAKKDLEAQNSNLSTYQKNFFHKISNNKLSKEEKEDLTRIEKGILEEIKRLKSWIKYNENWIKEKNQELTGLEKNYEPQLWRTNILQDLAIRILKWYLANGVFKSDLHQRLFHDTMEAILLESSGINEYFTNDQFQSNSDSLS